MTSNHKYLGMYLSEDSSDNLDIKRQIRGVYARGNSLIKRFRHCNQQTKVKLFTSYCSSFYCCTLWYKFSTAEFRKLKSSYNRIFRNLFNLSKDDMYNVMLRLGVKTFPEVLRNLIYGFSSRLLLCTNTIILAITSSMFFYCSPIAKYWKKQLYL